MNPKCYDATKGKFTGWILRCAEYRLIDQLRKRDRHREIQLGDEISKLAVKEKPAELSKENKYRLRLLKKTIATLSRRKRQVTEDDLRTGGDSTEFLAEELGISKNAVYKTRSGARKQLREILGIKPLCAES